MAKSATEIMQDILFNAVLDAVTALKDGSKGIPNALLRDVNRLHPNITFADLPQDVQAAIGAGVRAAFSRLRKEGYAISPIAATGPAPERRASPAYKPSAGPRGSTRPPRKRP